MGAERIISMSRHESRQKLVREFCATDLVGKRCEAGFERVKELAGERAESALECVGTQDSMTQATQSTRPGCFSAPVTKSMNTRTRGGRWLRVG